MCFLKAKIKRSSSFNELVVSAGISSGFKDG